MRISICAEDKAMHLDGKGETFNLELSDEIWAIQWYGTKGEIEYKDGRQNKPFDDLAPFQYLVAKHAARTVEREEEEAQAVIDANNTLQASLTYDMRRREAYYQLEQFELIYDDKINGTDTWVKAIQGVKKQYPKPE